MGSNNRWPMVSSKNFTKIWLTISNTIIILFCHLFAIAASYWLTAWYKLSLVTVIIHLFWLIISSLHKMMGLIDSLKCPTVCIALTGCVRLFTIEAAISLSGSWCHDYHLSVFHNLDLECPDGLFKSTISYAKCHRCPQHSKPNPTRTSCTCEYGFYALTLLVPCKCECSYVFFCLFFLFLTKFRFLNNIDFGWYKLRKPKKLKLMWEEKNWMENNESVFIHS